MQNEDNLRGLAKILEFMRALSIIFIIINMYGVRDDYIVVCGLNVGISDNNLLNFQNMVGLFWNILCTRLFRTLFLALSIFGDERRKKRKNYLK